ncbi:hypothetical protein ACE38W_04550 [Chitinophaga sp. Hz27]|uniref:hypothetical protein n=1 Tax=Chitinophaga sp. Hz27 TaxID=3347169 RepID=UPI0035DFD9D9
MKKLPVLLALGTILFSCSSKNDPKPVPTDPAACQLISLNNDSKITQPIPFFSYSFEYDNITGRMTSFTDDIYLHKLSHKADSIIHSYTSKTNPLGIPLRQILVKDKKSSWPAYRLSTSFYSSSQPSVLDDSTIFVMDDGGRVVKSVSYRYGTNQARDSVTFKYDAKGNISESESPAVKITYTYFENTFSPASLFVGFSQQLQYMPGFPMVYNGTNNIKQVKATYPSGVTQGTLFTDIEYTYVYNKGYKVDTIYAAYKLLSGETGNTFYKPAYNCN